MEGASDALGGYLAAAATAIGGSAEYATYRLALDRQMSRPDRDAGRAKLP
jgi:hypothetical protein